MRKIILLTAAAILFIGATPQAESTKEEFSNYQVFQHRIKKSIADIQEIIDVKLAMAEDLEQKAVGLTADDFSSPEGVDLFTEAKMQRMMVLKYRAAIACKKNLLNDK